MRHSIILLLLLLLSSAVQAQDDDATLRELYAQAENDYHIGRIEQARDVLLQHLSIFHGNMQQNALRLIALSYLARFDIEQTEKYVTLLLQENPYYSPATTDPPAFADIVNNLKAGMTATITTASSQAESLAEVPVPTTLITADMIKTSGARNLQEVLAAYVPGMNIIDCNDDINIAMRGIYSNGQEKILIMLNGHRLNGYATNTASPDFSMSLEKVKQIEVLRGPASSLYGGVALTAVVNIITKQGADVDGLQARAAAGNYGQLRGDVVFGKRYFDVDMLVWASIYHSSGEKYDVSSERTGESQYGMPYDHIRLRRIGDQPTYDFGLQLDWKGFQLLYDSRFSQVVAPFTLTSLAISYDRERYRTYNGLKPGFSNHSQHSDLSYHWSMLKMQWKAAATYDRADITRYQAINDLPMPQLGMAIDLPEAFSSVLDRYGGIARYVNGQEQNLGFQLKGSYAYTLADDHKGSIGFGAEENNFKVNDIRYQIGYDFDKAFPEDPNTHNEGKGSETSADVYLQLKHQWRALILNAGMRYDFKKRYDDTRINEFSPRVALILLRPKWNVKLSYSKSFVDAPFIYRKANVLTVVMSNGDRDDITDLSPEKVHSVQLSFAGNNWARGLNFEVNGFYNRATDLIMTHLANYNNASKNKTAGIELMASYRSPLTVSTTTAQTTGVPRFTADFNLTLMRTFRANLMPIELLPTMSSLVKTDIDDNNNTPYVMSNLVVGWQATRRLKLHTHILFEGSQSTYNTDLVNVVRTVGDISSYQKYYEAGMEQEAVNALAEAFSHVGQIVMHKEMPPRAILNLGAEYSLGVFSLGLNVHNLLGTRYYRSGMNTNLIPQQGRWIMGSVACKL